MAAYLAWFVGGMLAAAFVFDVLLHVRIATLQGRCSRWWPGGAIVTTFECLKMMKRAVSCLQAVAQLLIAYDATGKSNDTLTLLGKMLALSQWTVQGKKKAQEKTDDDGK